MIPSVSRRILVVAEQSDRAEPHLATRAVATFAQKLCGNVDDTWSVFTCTDRPIGELTGLRQLGARELLHCPLDASRRFLAEQVAPTICALVSERSFDFVVAAATSFGKDLLPRVAGTLDAAYVGDCTGLRETSSGVEFLRSVHAGNATAECVTRSRVVVVTTRSTEFERAPQDHPACPVTTVRHVAPTPMASRIEWLGVESAVSQRPALNEARVVVSGGRVLGSKFFEILGPLADAYGAALGATRALCDLGYVPSHLQVGQTGTIVAPELYFAIGISGSVQHLAGMHGSRIIVAINNDPDAPIFAHADLGLVGDLWLAVPELVRALTMDAPSRPP